MIYIAVVGCGKMGTHHLNVYNQLKGVKVVALCDLKAKKSKIPFYTDLNKMFKEHLEIDAVSITTPNSTHYKVAKKCLEKGAHVLVEKPFVTDLKQGRKLIKLAKKKRKVLMVGQLVRFNPVIRYLTENISKLGKITFIKSIRTRPPIKGFDRNLLYEVAIHDFDLFNHLFKIDFKGAHMIKQKDFLVIATQKMPLTIIEIHLFNDRDIRKLKLVGSKGVMELHFTPIPTVKFKGKGYEFTRKFMSENPLMNELSHFIDCVKNNKKPLVSGEDGLKAVEIIKRLEK